eukprot:8742791-Pyramimonas_sp.AAC.1
MRLLLGHHSGVRSLALSPCGKALASGAEDGARPPSPPLLTALSQPTADCSLLINQLTAGRASLRRDALQPTCTALHYYPTERTETDLLRVPGPLDDCSADCAADCPAD